MDRRTQIAATLLLLYALTTAGLAALDYDVAVREGYARSEGAELRYVEWAPRGGAARGAVVLYHGFGGSSEMMGWLGAEFARNGYRAVAYDNRGHGKSSSRLNHSSAALLADLEALRRGLELGSGELVLVGHSMGGMAVQSLAESDVPVQALVVLASRPRQTAPAPRSLLVLAGLDEIFSPRGLDLGALQGWEVFISPWDDHLTVLYSPGVIQVVLEWVLGGDPRNLSSERLALALARSAAALALLALIPAYTASRIGQPPRGGGWSRLLVASSLSSTAAPLLYPALVLITSAPVAAYVLAVLYAQSIGVLAVSWRRLGRVKELAQGFTPRVLASSLLTACLAYALAHEALQPFMNVELSVHRAGTAALLFALLFVPVLVFEVYARTQLLATSWAQAFTRALALRSLGFAAAWLATLAALGGGGFAGYLLIVTMVSLLLLLPIDAAATSWLSRPSTPVGGALWVSLLLSALLAPVTPLT